MSMSVGLKLDFWVQIKLWFKT